MPELPEVETIKRQLEERLVGLTISDIEVRNAKQFIGDKRKVIGDKIVGVERRGKMLIIEVQSLKLKDQSYLVVHLKMTGQLIYVDKIKNPSRFAPLQGKQGKQKLKVKNNGENYYFSQGIPLAGNYLPGKTTRVIFRFDNGARLFFNDNRKFGWVKILDSAKFKDQNAKLGIEPLSKEFTPASFLKLVNNYKRPIKLLLMDQEKIAGVGNIYANEALFLAGINPLRKGNTLSDIEIKNLYNSITQVLQEGIKYKGSSGKDESYINALGEPGLYQKHFRVYQREGKNCLRCEGRVKRVVVSGRGTFFCSDCQK